MKHNLYQNHSCLFVEIDKLILKFMWKYREARIPKTILKKKSKVGGYTVNNFKTYLESYNNQDWHKISICLDVWNNETELRVLKKYIFIIT